MFIILTRRRSFIQWLLSGSTGELPVFTSGVMLTLEPLKTCHPACYIHVFLVFFFCCSFIPHICLFPFKLRLMSSCFFFRISSERHRKCAALQHQQPYPEHVVPPSATCDFEAGLQTYLYSMHIIYNQISKSNQAFHLSC